jgi:hypothetical protein
MGFIINPYFFAAGTPFENTYSVDFDGIDDYVDLGDSNDLSFGDGSTDSAFSVSAWFKQSSADTGAFPIIGKYDSSDKEWLLYHPGAANNLQFILLLYDNSSGAYIGRQDTNAVTADTWHHIVATYSGNEASSGIKIYIDGVQVDDADVNSGSYTAMENTGGSFKMAGGMSGIATWYGNGNVDEVAVFSSELTSGNVTTIYNSGTPTDLSSLSPTAWYRMGDGDTYPMLNNEQAYSNRSVAFDGVDDYVTMGDVLDKSNTDPFSVSAWIKLSSVGTTHKVIVSKMDETSNFRGWNIRSYNGTLKISFSNIAGSNELQFTSTSTVFTVDTWHHVVVTYDGSSASSGVTAYVDNSTVSGSWSGTLSGTLANSASFDISSRNNGSLPFPGNIDEVSFFNSELSAGNVTTIYNSGKPADISALSPVGWWKMGEGDTYPTLTDSGSGSNDGTMTNMVAGDITGAETTGIMTNMVAGDIVADVPS